MNETTASGHILRRDTRASLLLLGGVIVFACIGLATDANWPKLLRVSSAFATYATVLVATILTRSGARMLGGFLAAGAAAGAVSGLVRPEIHPALVAISTLGGIVFGGVHWLAVTRWRGARADSGATLP